MNQVQLLSDSLTFDFFLLTFALLRREQDPAIRSAHAWANSKAATEHYGPFAPTCTP